jgi:hypothetical protein
MHDPQHGISCSGCNIFSHNCEAEAAATSLPEKKSFANYTAKLEAGSLLLLLFHSQTHNPKMSSNLWFIHKSHNESQSSQVEAESEEGEKKVFACRDLRLAISTTRARANKHERLPYQPTLFECIIVRQLTRPHESGMRLVSPDDACLCEHNMQYALRLVMCNSCKFPVEGAIRSGECSDGVRDENWIGRRSLASDLSIMQSKL